MRFCYQYLKGKQRKKGYCEASSLQQARESLREAGLLILSIRQEKNKKKGSLKGQDLIDFTSQLSQLLKAGLPLFESLLILEEEARQKPYHGSIENMCQSIKQGDSLSSAIETQTGFPPLYLSLVKAGESTGSLQPSLNRIVHLLTHEMNTKKNLISAMIYPGILGIFCIVVLFLLLTFAIPSIEPLMEDRSLGLTTQIVFSLSHFVTRAWPIYFPFLLLTSWACYRFIRSTQAKTLLHKFTLHTPLLRTLTIQSALSRFCHTFASLQSAGVPVYTCLTHSIEVMGHPSLQKVMTKAQQGIVEGRHLSEELKGDPMIPSLLIRALRIGEETGNIHSLLEEIASFYEQEVQKTLKRLMTLAQPILLLIMGTIVAIIMLAILLPLTDVQNLF